MSLLAGLQDACFKQCWYTAHGLVKSSFCSGRAVGEVVEKGFFLKFKVLQRLGFGGGVPSPSTASLEVVAMNDTVGRVPRIGKQEFIDSISQLSWHVEESERSLREDHFGNCGVCTWAVSRSVLL